MQRLWPICATCHQMRECSLKPCLILCNKNVSSKNVFKFSLLFFEPNLNLLPVFELSGWKLMVVVKGNWEHIYRRQTRTWVESLSGACQASLGTTLQKVTFLQCWYISAASSTKTIHLRTSLGKRLQERRLLGSRGARRIPSMTVHCTNPKIQTTSTAL